MMGTHTATMFAKCKFYIFESCDNAFKSSFHSIHAYFGFDHISHISLKSNSPDLKSSNMTHKKYEQYEPKDQQRKWLQDDIVRIHTLHKFNIEM